MKFPTVLAVGVVGALVLLMVSPTWARDAPTPPTSSWASETVTWSELSRSETARQHGLDNRIPSPIRPRLAALARAVVDPIRKRFGPSSVVITSAYRSPSLNATIPGAHPQSLHQQGRALDLASPLLSPAELAGLLREHFRGRLLIKEDHLHVEW